MLSAMTAMSVLRFSKRAAFVPVRPLGVREVHLAASRESRGAVSDRPASCSSRNAPRQSLRVRASATRAPVSMTVSRHHCARSRVALFASPRWNIKKGPCPSRSATPVLKGPISEFIQNLPRQGNAWHPCRMSTTAWRFSLPAPRASDGRPRPASTMGSTVNGSQSWLRLGGLSIQPSELAKLAVVVGMALVLAGAPPRAAGGRTSARSTSSLMLAVEAGARRC